MNEVASISVSRLAQLAGQGNVDVIDVRTAVEFREVRAQGVVNVPLDSLNPDHIMNGRNGCADQPLYVICRTGNRSAKACQRFIDAGHRNVVNVDGGTKAWDEAGLPVIRGKKAISLERQVRIAAGLLVLLGAVLGLVLHPYFLGISAFVGAGLVFAGITDTCGMGMLLAKMPWNRVTKCDSGQCSK